MSHRRTSDSLDRLREDVQRRILSEDEQAYRTPPPSRRNPNAMGPSEEILERRRRARHHVETATAARESGSMAENLILLFGMAGSLFALYCLCVYLLQVN